MLDNYLVHKTKKQAKKQAFKGFKTYEPIKELNTDKAKSIAKSIKDLK